MDWSDIFGVGASALSGGLFGLLGVGLKQVGAFFTEHQRRMARKDEMAHELLLLEKQSQMKVIESENERAIVALQQDGAIKQRSYDVFNNLGKAHKIVVSTVTLMPVLITIALWCMVAYLVHLIVDTGITVIDGKVLIKQIVDNVVFCAVAVTLWWIGEHPPQNKIR